MQAWLRMMQRQAPSRLPGTRGSREDDDHEPPRGPSIGLASSSSPSLTAPATGVVVVVTSFAPARPAMIRCGEAGVGLCSFPEARRNHADASTQVATRLATVILMIQRDGRTRHGTRTLVWSPAPSQNAPDPPPRDMRHCADQGSKFRQNFGRISRNSVISVVAGKKLRIFLIH